MFRSRPYRYWLLRIPPLLMVGVLAIGLAIFLPWYNHIREEAIAMVDLHEGYLTAHPGWSFPGFVWSDSVPINLPNERIVLEAKARGYSEACPPKNPGEYCKKTGAVVLRGGRFPEGIQPAGNEGWTRPLAFEPVLLGMLVGVDGEWREHLPIEAAPKHLLAAIFAAEDERFQEHQGVDIWGTIRAAISTARGNSQGGSTLTMQLVRNLTQEKDRTFTRKLREMAFARAVDRYLGKDRVLQMYLDAPYLGQAGNLSVCGFQAASRYYWGKDANELSLAEAATLAAILPAPGRFAPDRNPEEAKIRRDRLLKKMGEQGWDVAAALEEPISATPHALPGERYPAYFQTVRAQLEADLPLQTLYGAGLQVFTGLNLVVQDQTDSLMTERVRYLERVSGRRGKAPLLSAGSVVDPTTGALIAVYDTSLRTSTDFNRATQARRQAGSSFKPLVYALGFMPGEDGKPRFAANHTVPNHLRDFPGTNGWRPKNIGGRYSNTVPLASGLAMSHNIATASLLEELGGPKPLIEFAATIGIDTSAFPEEMGIALGQGQVTTQEMARFVATIASGGKHIDAKPVKIALDPRGEVRWVLRPPEQQILTPEAAVLTRELMTLVITSGTGGSARGGGGFPGFDGPMFGKTGTTDLERDLWFTGSTPTYSAALWLGYNEPTPIGASASDFAAPLFGWWMRAVHMGLPREKFVGPKVEHQAICTQSGKLPGMGCHLISAPFIPGTKPNKSCTLIHPPEPEEPLLDEHKSLWERIAEQRAAADAAQPPASTPKNP